jgi:predicted Rdx family selenoprotein
MIEIHTKEQLAEVEEFFSSIKPAIESFCRDHNFLTRKYVKQAASWQLQGRLSSDRSKTAVVTLIPERGGTILISFHICLDNFKTLERKVYWSPKEPCEKSPTLILAVLQDLLKKIENFDGKWSDSTTLSDWSGYSNQELEILSPEYPRIRF